jgi:hypothetical protein
VIFDRGTQKILREWAADFGASPAPRDDLQLALSAAGSGADVSMTRVSSIASLAVGHITDGLDSAFVLESTLILDEIKKSYTVDISSCFLKIGKIGSLHTD